MEQQANQSYQQHSYRGISLALLLLLLGSIALLSAVGRLETLFASGIAPQDPGDASYIQHPAIALLHLIPGSIFLLLGPLQFIPSLRARRPALHRWCGRLIVISGFCSAITAIAMNSIFPAVGGILKSTAIITFSLAMMLALSLALRAILRRDLNRHRAWMIRAFAIGLGVSTMRIYFIPVYFLYGLPSDLHIALGVWIGFGVNLLVAEFIIKSLK